MGQFSPVYRFAFSVARQPVGWVTRRHWSGMQNLPTHGGYIVASNHISEFDSMTLMHFIGDQGVPVRTIAKKELFDVPGLGWLMHQAGQIPVDRKEHARDVLAPAEEALRAGECLAIYPEGTVTRDLHGWPMRGRTGVARLALRAGVPVIPLGQWGAQDVFGRYDHIPNLLGRSDVWVKAGTPVDLSDLAERKDDPQAWREATDRIMAAITHIVEDIRGEKMGHQPIDSKDPGVFSKKQLGAIERQRIRQLQHARLSKWFRRS